jgi:hypothetical protein
VPVITRMNRQSAFASAVLAASFSLLASAASADSLKPGDERFKFVAGWFLPAFTTDVRIDSTTQPGDEVHLGDDLGLDEDQSGALLGFEWRMAKRHRLGITWSRFSNEATRVIDEEITIDGVTFPIDASLRSEWSIDLIPITYSYSFLQSERNELAATFGIHWDRISLRVAGTLGNSQVVGETDSSADLPLPLIGLRYDHHFSENWSTGIAASYFTIEFGEDELDAEGSLYGAKAYAEYRFRGRYGAGLAIDAFKLDLEATKSNFAGGYEYEYWGPQLYFTARF